MAEPSIGGVSLARDIKRGMLVGKWAPLAVLAGFFFSGHAAPSALDEVRTMGRLTGSVRTPEQTSIAMLWAAQGGTVTPPGMWNQIAEHQVLVVAQRPGLGHDRLIGLEIPVYVAYDQVAH